VLSAEGMLPGPYHQSSTCEEDHLAGVTVDHGSAAADEQPSAVMGCITAIPICGGFCADTQSPETGCLRHFSNETTPPQPCLKRYACRRFWEHSPWCRGIGRVGTAFGDRNRGYIMLSAFAVSFVAWILTFAAFAATSSQAGMIRDTCWAKSTATFSPTLHPPLGATVTSYVGIGSRVDVIDTPGEASTTSVVEWSTPGSCTLLNGVSYPRCEQCGAKSQEALQWLITSAITQVFQMTTDLQRTTRYGDLNCQKALGTLTGIYGTVATMQSLKAFMYECAGRGPEEYFRHRVEYLLPVPAETAANASGANANAANANAANASSAERVAVEIRGGPGFALLLLATLLKLYDVACHASVPTPLPKREAAAQGLGLQEYMQRSREETRFGRVVADAQALLLEPQLQAAQSTEARRLRLPLPRMHPRAGASAGLQGEGAQGVRDVPVQVRLPGVELGRQGTLQAGAGGDGAVAKAEAAAAAAAKAEAERVAAAEEAAEAAAVAAEAERVAAAEAAAEAAAAAEAEAERVAAAEEEAAAKEAEAEAERFAAAEAEAAAAEAEAERVAAVAAAKAEAERVAAAEAAEAAAKEAEAKRAAAESGAAREAG
jgi:hypothetical protein